jgi:hypothetical protein
VARVADAQRANPFTVLGAGMGGARRARQCTARHLPQVGPTDFGLYANEDLE